MSSIDERQYSSANEHRCSTNSDCNCSYVVTIDYWQTNEYSSEMIRSNLEWTCSMHDNRIVRSIISTRRTNSRWIHTKWSCWSVRIEIFSFVRWKCYMTNHRRIFVSSLGSLFIYAVEESDAGDYVCIASNVFGQSYSSRRSLIVSGEYQSI
jgi:hypothetical protein